MTVTHNDAALACSLLCLALTQDLDALADLTPDPLTQATAWAGASALAGLATEARIPLEPLITALRASTVQHLKAHEDPEWAAVIEAEEQDENGQLPQ
jgi:hypothetical protein